jgi:geranylgeranyl pyrophosphate synthase
LNTDTSLGIPNVDAELETRLRDRLNEVEQELVTAVDADMPFVTEAARHLLDAGGKRFRPMLVLLAAEFGDRDATEVVSAAQVVELTHVATLYHDDVMDEALLRRGAQSANARWDNNVAILVGDYLFARASIIVATLGPEAVDIQARTFSRLVQGQIRETFGPPDGQDPLAHYLSVVADKTGSLIATSARFGARCSGAPPAVESALTEFGERIGSCFQLSDDIIDVASEAGDLGKTPGTDLREGVPTLPALLAVASTDPADARLRELLQSDLSDDELLAEALDLLRRHSAIAEARAYVRKRADEAREVLAPLPDVPARAALEALCDLVVSRSA